MEVGGNGERGRLDKHLDKSFYVRFWALFVYVFLLQGDGRSLKGSESTNNW